MSALSGLLTGHRDGKHGASGVESKGKDSIMYTRAEASKLSVEDIYGIGVDGFQELCEIDPSFALHESIFSREYLERNRESEGSEFNEEINSKLGVFIRKLTARLELECAHRIMEYLIRHFMVNHYNKEDLFRAIICHHDSKLFAKFLSLIPIDDTSPMRFFKGHDKGVIRRSLVQQCIKDREFLKFITDLVSITIADGNDCKQVANLFLFIFYEMTNTEGFDDNLLLATLPTVMECARQKELYEFQITGLLCISNIGTKIHLTTEGLTNTMDTMVTALRADIAPQCVAVMVAVHAFQGVTKFTLRQIEKFASSSGFASILSATKKRFSADSTNFIKGVLKGCVHSAVKSLAREKCVQLFENILSEAELGEVIQTVCVELTVDIVSLHLKRKKSGVKESRRDVLSRLLRSIANRFPKEFDEGLNEIFVNLQKNVDHKKSAKRVSKWMTEEFKGSRHGLIMLNVENVESPFLYANLRHQEKGIRLQAITCSKAIIDKATLSGDMESLIALPAVLSECLREEDDIDMSSSLASTLIKTFDAFVGTDQLNMISSEDMNAISGDLSECLEKWCNSELRAKKRGSVLNKLVSIMVNHIHPICPLEESSIRFIIGILPCCGKVRSWQIDILKNIECIEHEFFNGLVGIVPNKKSFTIVTKTLTALANNFMPKGEETKHIKAMKDLLADTATRKFTLAVLDKAIHGMIIDEDKLISVLLKLLPSFNSIWNERRVYELKSEDIIKTSTNTVGAEIAFLLSIWSGLVEKISVEYDDIINAETKYPEFDSSITAPEAMKVLYLVLGDAPQWLKSSVAPILETVRVNHMFGKNGARYMSIVMGVVSGCDSKVPDSILVSCLDQAVSCLLKLQLKSWNGICYLLPSILLALRHNSGVVRTAALNFVTVLETCMGARKRSGNDFGDVCVIAGVKPLAVTSTRNLLTYLSSHATELIADGFFLITLLGNAFGQNNDFSDAAIGEDLLTFLVSCATHMDVLRRRTSKYILLLSKAPLHRCYNVWGDMLTQLSNACFCATGGRKFSGVQLKCAQLLLRTIQNMPDEEFCMNDSIFIRVICSLITRGADVKDTKTRAQQRMGDDYNNSRLAQICGIVLSALDCLSAGRFSKCSSENQCALFLAISDLQKSADGSMVGRAQSMICELTIHANVFLMVWENVGLPAENNNAIIGTKRARSSVGIDAFTWLNRVSCLVETLGKATILEKHLLVEKSFDILKLVANCGVEEIDLVEFTRQLVVEFLQELCKELSSKAENERLAASKPAAIMTTAMKRMKGKQKKEITVAEIINKFDLNVLVDCVQSTSNRTTRNQCIVLMAGIGSMFPSLVLDHLLPLLASKNNDTQQQTDKYTFDVLITTIQLILPAVCKHKLSVCKVIQTFVDMFDSIPSYLRLRLFGAIIKNLSNDYLHVAFTMLLARDDDEEEEEEESENEEEEMGSEDESNVAKQQEQEEEEEEEDMDVDDEDDGSDWGSCDESEDNEDMEVSLTRDEAIKEAMQHNGQPQKTTDGEDMIHFCVQLFAMFPLNAQLQSLTHCIDTVRYIVGENKAIKDNDVIQALLPLRSIYELPSLILRCCRESMESTAFRHAIADSETQKAKDNAEEHYLNMSMSLFYLLRLVNIKKAESNVQGNEDNENNNDDDEESDSDDDSDEEDGEFFDEINEKAFEVYETLQSMLSTGSFVAVMEMLMTDEDTAIRRRALKQLDQKVVYESQALDDDEALLFLDLLDDLVDVISSNQESDANVQIALQCMTTLANGCGHLAPERLHQPFIAIQRLLTNILNRKKYLLKYNDEKREVVACALITSAAISRLLDSNMMAAMNSFCGSIVTVMSQNNEKLANLTGEEEEGTVIGYRVLQAACLSSVISTMNGSVCPPIISIYCKQLIVNALHPTILSNKFVGEGRKSIELLSILAEIIPTRYLASHAIQAYDTICNYSDKLLEVFFEFVGDMCKNMDAESTRNHNASIFKFFLKALETRANNYAKNIKRVEHAIVESCLCLIMKLNENQLRPLFISAVDWMRTDVAEPILIKIPFYRLLSGLTDKLKSIFVPYFEFVLGDCIGDLMTTHGVLSVQPDDEYDLNSKIRQDSFDLCRLVMKSLHQCFLYDNSEFMQQEGRLESVMVPITDQIECVFVPGGEDAGKKYATDLIAPTIAQLHIAIDDDKRWKPLNFKVLLKTRSLKTGVRYNSLLCILESFTKVGEEFLVLLAETLPYLLELCEDAAPEVEVLCHSVIREIEALSGESLREYID